MLTKALKKGYHVSRFLNTMYLNGTHLRLLKCMYYLHYSKVCIKPARLSNFDVGGFGGGGFPFCITTLASLLNKVTRNSFGSYQKHINYFNTSCHPTTQFSS